MTPKEERPRGLGRGLSALIGDEADAVAARVPSALQRAAPAALPSPATFGLRPQAVRITSSAVAVAAVSERPRGRDDAARVSGCNMEISS